MPVDRFGESAIKEAKAKVMLREGKLSYQQIAAAVSTSKSQVQRFANELKEEGAARPAVAARSAAVAAVAARSAAADPPSREQTLEDRVEVLEELCASQGGALVEQIRRLRDLAGTVRSMATSADLERHWGEEP